ncbi:type IX secretion system protein PorG [Rhodoflexus sp.]
MPFICCKQRLLLVVVACFGLITVAQAQRYEIGAGIGAGNYKGDVAPAVRIENSKLGANVFFRYNPFYFLSLRANLMVTDLVGRDSIFTDPFQQRRDFHFSSNLRELALTAEYNFFNFRKTDRRKMEKWCPFLFGGIAVANHGGKTNYLDNRDYNGTHIVLPFGVGVKHYLHPNWNLGFEFGARKTFTDRIDGITLNQADPKFRQSNPYSRDMYYFAGITLSYVFYSVRCAEPFGSD